MKPLRAFLLKGFKILGIVEYPHSAFFENWTIATSLLIATKQQNVADTHSVKFIRCTADPRLVDLVTLSRAFYHGNAWPADWRMREVPQRELKAADGWKRFFATEIETEFRFTNWPTIPSLFRRSRRGSLEKEGGGIAIFECPFDRTQYGPRRVPEANGRPFQTGKGPAPLQPKIDNCGS